MPNRNLSLDELDQANRLLKYVRARLSTLSRGDPELLFAFRRKLFKELSYDERGKPMHRRKLKELMRGKQKGICKACKEPLPEKYCVLDRKVAAKGYTPDNTRLICPACDARIQASRRFK